MSHLEILLVVFTALIVGSYVWLRIPSKGTKTHSSLDEWRRKSTNWANLKDVADLVVDEHAIPCGRTIIGWLHERAVAVPANRSIGVMAPSGSGKTPRVLAPRANEHHGPAVLASTKADLLYLTRQAREQQGRILVFDPSDTSGIGNSVRWSPMLGITDWSGCWTVADDLVKTAKSVDSRGLEGQDHWDSMGRQLIAPLLFACMHTNKSIAQAYVWIKATSGEETVQSILERIGHDGASAAWNAYLRFDERTKSNILATASTVLEVWARDEIGEMIDIHSGSDRPILDLDSLINSTDTLYLLGSDQQQAELKPVFESLVNGLIRRVQRAYQTNMGVALSPPMLLMLDEAANIAPLRDLDKILSTCAGQGLIIITAWQDYGQLVATFGEARARVIWSNHYAQIFLPGINDQRTLQEISTNIGTDIYQTRSVSTSRSGGSTSTGQHFMPVGDVAWLRGHLERDEAIVFTGFYKPLLLKVPAWFEKQSLRAMVDPEYAARLDAQFAQPASKKARKRANR